jgi:hypothetical protein
MKVLIISHNPITTYQNMGKTMLSLFSAFDKSELCQLYIYPTVPDIDVCNSYYRVTDRDVLNSYFRFGRVASRVIHEDGVDTDQHNIYETEREANFFKKSKKSPITLIFRDLMWSFSRWYSATLKKWLAEEKPTCIFLAPGESKFIYNIALKISKELNIDMVTYVCDDYFFVKHTQGIAGRFQLYLLRKKMKKAMQHSIKIVTICDELSEVYHYAFGTETQTVFTGSSFPVAEHSTEPSNASCLTYMGNLTCNRAWPIADIGRALDRLNQKKGTNYKLLLYAPPLKEDTISLFSSITSIVYCGYVVGEAFDRILHNPTILLHVESFDFQSIDRVKHSVSTKIADSLGSGNLFFAYGPDKVASVRHLIRNDCAVVVTNPEDLDGVLDTLWQRKDRCEIIERAIATAKEYHSSNRNSLIMRNIFCEITTGKSQKGHVSRDDSD